MSESLLGEVKFPVQFACDICGHHFSCEREGLKSHEVNRRHFIRLIRTTVVAACPACDANVGRSFDELLPDAPNTLGELRAQYKVARGNGAGPLEAIGFAKFKIRLVKRRIA